MILMFHKWCHGLSRVETAPECLSGWGPSSALISGTLLAGHLLPGTISCEPLTVHS